VRGAAGRRDKDAILAARRRNASTETCAKVTAVAQELARGTLIQDPARAKLLDTRRAVVAGWLAAAEMLNVQGEASLAADVRNFVRQMPPVMNGQRADCPWADPGAERATKRQLDSKLRVPN
jgi:hypothetical protein